MMAVFLGKSWGVKYGRTYQWKLIEFHQLRGLVRTCYWETEGQVLDVKLLLPDR
jgi:hypothetical protein